MDYNGFSFAEKKDLKQYEGNWETAQKKIKDKLGSGWSLHIDWPAFQAAVPKEDDRRSNLPNAIYNLYCPNLGDEVDGYEPDLVEAINGRVTAKKITIGLDKSGEELNRYRVTVGDDVFIGVEPAKIGYEYPYSSSHCMKSALENAL